MQKVLLAAAAVGALAFASSAYAQSAEHMYLSKSGDQQMVITDTTPDGTALLIGAGAKPGECPAGSFYTTDASQQMVMKCDDDAQYMLSAPASGAMMPSGEPYPEGAQIMTVNP